MERTESPYSEQTMMSLARSGALVRILCQADACQTCQALSARTYTPSEAPRLPVHGCTNPTCRCRYVAVDPQSGLTVEEMVRQGIQAIQNKNHKEARRILRRVVELDELNEQGWLWLSGVVDDPEKVRCLEKVLAINPQNRRAQAGLEYLRHKRSESSMPLAMPPGESAAQPPTVTKQAEHQPHAALPTWPAQVVEARERRQVIIAQWQEFLDISTETDPDMLLMQGSAFLKQLDRLNRQALETLSSPQRLEELELQWQESEAIGEPLADLLHSTDQVERADRALMIASLRQLAQKVLEHRKTLREQIAAEGGPPR